MRSILKNKKRRTWTVAALVLGCAALVASIGGFFGNAEHVAARATQYVPIYYFYASPSTVEKGSPTVIYYAAGNADYCVTYSDTGYDVSGVNVAIAPAGAYYTHPQSSQNYWLFCINTGRSNWGVSAYTPTYVSVTQPPPVPCTSGPNACGQTSSGFSYGGGACDAATPSNSTCPAPSVAPASPGFSAQPSTLGSPQSVMLKWDIANATACSVTGSNGFSHTGGTAKDSVQTNTLTDTTSFTLTCQDGEGGPTASFSVKVIPTPNFKEI